LALLYGSPFPTSGYLEDLQLKIEKSRKEAKNIQFCYHKIRKIIHFLAPKLIRFLGVQ
jgi:hypothetical protein